MKKLLITAIALISFNSFSQTFMALNNGVILTVDKNGFVYDFNHFFLPYKISDVGGSYLIEDEKLVTIDENGLLYRKDQKVKKIEIHGANYFIDDSDELYTINSKGFVFKYKDDEFDRVEAIGGNFFTNYSDRKEKDLQLYVIDNAGSVFKLQVTGLDPREINHAGGNYFITNSKQLFSVSTAGIVMAHPEVKVGFVKKRGGNFFIDSNGILFAITTDGKVTQPPVPTTFNVGSIKQVGQNYMITSYGKLYVVTADGKLFERVVTNHDLNNVKLTSF